MARKNESPQKAAMREMMRDYLKNNDISIKSGTDVNSVMRDMMSVLPMDRAQAGLGANSLPVRNLFWGTSFQ